MKKCGILTWHYLDNYGSFLQAYALQEILKSKMLDVSIINYRKDASTGLISDFMRWVKYNLPFQKSKNLRKKRFYTMRKKYLTETKMCKNSIQLKKLNSFDMYICGSDQIWSANRFDKTYFFDFLEKGKLYSYAPSTVIDNYDEEQKKVIKELLPKFSKISVREKKGVEILQKIVNNKIYEVLDPTLLFDKNFWLKNVSKKIENDYILCYLIGDDCKFEKQIKNYAKKKNKKLVNICIQTKQKFGDVIIEDLDPFNFLNLINNCDTFFTDSYHGVLFAINFNINFFALKRFEDNEKNNQNDRIINILEKLNLMSRYKNKDNKLIDKEINYNSVNFLLEKYRNKSLEYIDDIVYEVNYD